MNYCKRASQSITFAELLSLSQAGYVNMIDLLQACRLICKSFMHFMLKMFVSSPHFARIGTATELLSARTGMTEGNA